MRDSQSRSGSHAEFPSRHAASLQATELSPPPSRPSPLSTGPAGLDIAPSNYPIPFHLLPRHIIGVYFSIPYIPMSICAFPHSPLQIYIMHFYFPFVPPAHWVCKKSLEPPINNRYITHGNPSRTAASDSQVTHQAHSNSPSPSHLYGGWLGLPCDQP